MIGTASKSERAPKSELSTHVGQPSLLQLFPLGFDVLILLLITSSLMRLALMTRLVPVPPDPAGVRSDNEFLTKWFVLSFLLLGVFFYVLSDIFTRTWPSEMSSRWSLIVKWLVLIEIVVIFDVTSTATWIALRHAEGSVRHVHDGAVQVEEAIRALLSGQNCYGFDYSKTPMRDWSPGWDNPALYHFVYLPFLTLFSLPFQVASTNLLGWYDQRFVFLLCIVGCLLLLPFLAKSAEARLSAVMIGLLNPALAMYLPEGRNDIFTLFWLLLSIVLLQRSKTIAACVCIGLTLASKQSAWPVVPFLLAYLMWSPQQGGGTGGGQSRSISWKPAAALIIPFALCVVPFLIWDFQAFIDDTIRYQTGTTAHSFPIRGLQGYGFGSLLLFWQCGNDEVCRELAAQRAFPFWILQAAVGIPILLLLLAWQRKRNTIGRMMIGYGLLLFVTQYFARAFHDNYWGYIVTIVGLGFLMDAERSNASES